MNAAKQVEENVGELGPPRDVAFRARFDGAWQRYVEMLPTGYRSGETYDLALALHGQGSDRWQYVREERGECRGARDVAARRGMVFVSPDYRAPASWMNAAAEADVVQIVEEQRARRRIDRVFLVGGSMGGAAALTFAALHSDLVNGVVSENGVADHLWYDHLQDPISAAFGGTKEDVPDEYRLRSAASWPERFTMPVAITASGQDEAVPPDSVLQFAETLRQRGGTVLLLFRPDVGHWTDYEDTVEAFEFVFAAAREPQRKEGKP